LNAKSHGDTTAASELGARIMQNSGPDDQPIAAVATPSVKAYPFSRSPGTGDIV
jgi:hypothetical protein